MKGYVYILINPLFTSYLKIGKTTRLAEQRAKEIYKQAKTGIPTEYVVAYEIEVTDCGLVEKHVHQLLDKRKVNQDREFFKISLKEAIDVINRVADDLNKQHKIEFLHQLVKPVNNKDWWSNLSFTWQQVIRNHLDISYSPNDIDILRAVHSIIEHSQDENLRKRVASFIVQKKCIDKLKNWYESLDKERALFNSYLPYELSEDEIILAHKLKYINCLNQTSIMDLKPLTSFKYLEIINFTNTQVSDFTPLKDLFFLREIICNYTDVNKLDALSALPDLQKITCYETKITQESIAAFNLKSPTCKIETESFLQYPTALSNKKK